MTLMDYLQFGEVSRIRLIYRSEAEAARLYERALRQARLRQLFGRLSGRPSDLLDLSAVTASTPIQHRHRLGLRLVPLAQIQGSEGRSRDFDRHFNPLQSHTEARWLSLATAWHRGESLPPVHLIRVGELYFVRDGHHRVSVLRAMGQVEIEAVVDQWQVTAPTRCRLAGEVIPAGLLERLARVHARVMGSR